MLSAAITFSMFTSEEMIVELMRDLFFQIHRQTSAVSGFMAAIRVMMSWMSSRSASGSPFFCSKQTVMQRSGS